MNTTSAIESKSVFFAPSFLLRFLPKRADTQILNWAFLPFLFLILNSGIASLQPSVMTPYLPFLALICAGTTLCFKIKGLLGSYLVLALVAFFFIPPEGRFWQIGLLTSHAITLLLLLLNFEQADHFLNEMRAEKEEKSKLAFELQKNLTDSLSLLEEKKKEFDEELQRLKEEAELRKIDRATDAKHLALIHSELDLLIAQKDEFIVEAEQARCAAKRLAIEIESLKVQLIHEESLKKEQSDLFQSLTTQHRLLEEKNAIDEQRLLALTDQLKLGQEEVVNLQATICKLQVNSLKTIPNHDFEQMQLALIEKERLHKQLRVQFAEKSEILSATRQELFKLEGALIGCKQEHYWHEIENGQEESTLLARQISTLVAEVERLEEVIAHLEGLVSHILSQ